MLSAFEKALGISANNRNFIETVSGFGARRSFHFQAPDGFGAEFTDIELELRCFEVLPPFGQKVFQICLMRQAYADDAVKSALSAYPCMTCYSIYVLIQQPNKQVRN